MATARTLHVKCLTWEQVDTFHSRKLRRGRILSMKVPFQTDVGSPMTLGLELPNGVVIAIDGNVVRASQVEGDPGKTWIEVQLVGFTDDLLAKLKAMVSGAAATAAPAAVRRSSSALALMEELPADERVLFQRLSTELRKLRQLAVHEVLGVERDAGPDAIRQGWMNLMRKHHPDLVARRSSAAITHLAEELTILANRAYDRLRAALVAEGRGSAFGPAISAPPGWLVGFEDLSSGETATPAPPQPRPGGRFATIPPPLASQTTPPPLGVQGGEAFEVRARAMLGEGDANNAQEVLAAALCVYPRSRPLRSLYYVAAAIAALEKGELMLATSQLETALAHHEQCTEAAAILEHLRKHGSSETDAMRKLFR